MLFGTIPLNLTTSQSIHIDNTGDCHAYYKVSIDNTGDPTIRSASIDNTGDCYAYYKVSKSNIP